MNGMVYGSYRIIGKLGEGSMGVVYEAEHLHVGRKAAIKLLLPKWTNSKVVVERFFNEARSSALANHQGIVNIFDCGFADDGNAFLVMELLQGQPLAEILARSGPLPVRRMTSLARQLAGALAAAHDKGIVHRDLKPDNIFVIPDRDAQTGESVKVLDFGIAKLASSGRATTQSGALLGTPLYMSPEQCVSSEEVDGRSDVYALGCIMFEMLCGQPPFVHDEADEVAAMQIHAPPPRPRQLRPDIPANVESLIMRTLAKDREARPQSMADLRTELDVVWSLLPDQPVSEGAAESDKARSGPILVAGIHLLRGAAPIVPLDPASAAIGSGPAMTQPVPGDPTDPTPVAGARRASGRLRMFAAVFMLAALIAAITALLLT